MPRTGQHMHEGRNPTRKIDARAKKVGVRVHASATGVARERPVVAAEVCDETNILKRLVFRAGFPTVQVGMAGNRGRWAGCWAGTEENSRVRYGSPEIRITSKHLKFVLRAERRWKKERKEETKGHKSESQRGCFHVSPRFWIWSQRIMGCASRIHGCRFLT